MTPSFDPGFPEVMLQKQKFCQSITMPVLLLVSCARSLLKLRFGSVLLGVKLVLQAL